MIFFLFFFQEEVDPSLLGLIKFPLRYKQLHSSLIHTSSERLQPLLFGVNDDLRSHSDLRQLQGSEVLPMLLYALLLDFCGSFKHTSVGSICLSLCMFHFLLANLAHASPP